MNYFKSAGTVWALKNLKPNLAVCQIVRNCGKLKKGCMKTCSCWNCKEVVDCAEQFFCNKCDHIQPIGQQNLFEYMGMDTAYRIDDGKLKQRFRDLQFKLHPDKFAQATEAEKIMSDNHSRHLNKAFKTLSEPLSRARYLLEILGERDSSADLSPENLMEMMEWNERVVEMDSSSLLKEKENVQEHIVQCLSELQDAFYEKNINVVKEKVTMLSYLYSLRKNIEERL